MLALTSWMMTNDPAGQRVTGGILTAVIAVPVIATSIWVLTVRVKRRRAIEREIWETPPISRSPLTWSF